MDRYETGGIDDDDENDAEMSVEQRRRAEREIKRRDRERRRRLGQELNESDFDDDDEDNRPIGLSSKEKRSRMHDDDVGMDDDVNLRSQFDLHFSPFVSLFSRTRTSRILATRRATRSPIGCRCPGRATKWFGI